MIFGLTWCFLFSQSFIDKITTVRVKIPIIASKKFGNDSKAILKNSGTPLFRTSGLIYLKKVNVGIIIN